MTAYALRVFAPLALDAAGLREHAHALRTLSHDVQCRSYAATMAAAHAATLAAHGYDCVSMWAAAAPERAAAWSAAWAHDAAVNLPRDPVRAATSSAACAEAAAAAVEAARRDGGEMRSDVVWAAYFDAMIAARQL